MKPSTSQHDTEQKTEVTQLLRILSLACLLYVLDLQAGLRMIYVLLAIDSLHVMSTCDQPGPWTVAPRYIKELTSSTSKWKSRRWNLCLGGVAVESGIPGDPMEAAALFLKILASAGEKGLCRLHSRGPLGLW